MAKNYLSLGTTLVGSKIGLHNSALGSSVVTMKFRIWRFAGVIFIFFDLLPRAGLTLLMIDFLFLGVGMSSGSS